MIYSSEVSLSLFFLVEVKMRLNFQHLIVNHDFFSHFSKQEQILFQDRIQRGSCGVTISTQLACNVFFVTDACVLLFLEITCQWGLLVGQFEVGAPKVTTIPVLLAQVTRATRTASATTTTRTTI